MPASSLRDGLQANSAILDALAQLDSIADLPWLTKGIGEPFPLMTDKTGVNTPPIDSALFRFIELTAGLTGSGQYNEGCLTSESTSGSAPLVSSTGQISLSGSPMNGQTIRLINTEERFLRASASPGTAQNDQMQRVTGSAGPFLRGTLSTSGALTSSADAGTQAFGGSTSRSFGTVNFDSADSTNARTGTETRSKNLGVKYFMRIL